VRGLKRALSEAKDMAGFTTAIEPLERVSRAAGPNLAVMQLLSLLFTIAATSDDWALANLKLGKAFLYDPANQSAQECEAKLHVQARGPQPEVLRALMGLNLERSERAREAFATSPEGMAIWHTHRVALERAFVERLGLDPEEPRHRSAAAGLLAHL